MQMLGFSSYHQTAFQSILSITFELFLFSKNLSCGQGQVFVLFYLVFFRGQVLDQIRVHEYETK